MACNPLTDPTGCLGPATGGQATSGWDAICASFGHAAQQLLSSFASSFASSFTAIPPLSLTSAGLRSAYGLSLVVAGLIAAGLLMLQVIRTVLTHDGSAIAHGLTGIGKAVLAFLLTLTVAATALRASDELTHGIIAASVGSPQALSKKLSGLVSFDPTVSASLVFILALLGILLTVALWAQLLLRNVAVALLVAVSPVAAAGQIGTSAQVWWRKLVRAALQLIVLKPMVALVIVLGLTLPGTGDQVEKLLAGMVVLLLAASAWPVLARVSAVMDVHVGGGFLAGITGSRSARVTGGEPSGVAPAELSRVAERRTMSVLNDFSLRVRGTTPAAAVPVGADGPRPWRQAGHLLAPAAAVAGVEGRQPGSAPGEKDQEDPERNGAGPPGNGAAGPGRTA